MPVTKDSVCVEGISASVSLGAPFQVDVTGQGASTHVITTNSSVVRAWEAVVPEDVVLTLQGTPNNRLPQVEYRVPIIQTPLVIGTGEQFFTDILHVDASVMRNLNLFPLVPADSTISVHFYMLPDGANSTPIKGIVICTGESLAGDLRINDTSYLNWQTGELHLHLPHPIAPDTDIKLGYFPGLASSPNMQEFMLPSVAVEGERHFIWQPDFLLNDMAYGSVEIHARSITGKFLVVRSTKDGKLEGDIDTAGVNRVNYASCSVDVTFAEIVSFQMPVVMHYATYQTVERFTKYDDPQVPVTITIPWKDINRIYAAGIQAIGTREQNHKYGDR